MRQTCHILLMLIMPVVLHAQDTLYKRDGVIQIVQIIDAQGPAVKYIPLSSNVETTFIISKAEIIKIVYHDGSIETFIQGDYLKILPNQGDPLKMDFGRHFISFSLFDYFQSSIGLGYEYIGKSGKWGVKFPISFRFLKGARKDFSTGLSLYWYPFGQGRYRYFGGPSFEYNSGYYGRDTKQFGFLFQNGCLFQITKNVNASINLGVGYFSTTPNDNDYYYSNYYKKIQMKLACNVGYKF